MNLRTWNELEQHEKLTLAAIWVLGVAGLIVAYKYPLLSGVGIALTVIQTVVVLTETEEDE